MENDLRTLEREVSEMKKKLTEIHGAIVGNPLTKDGGITQRLLEAEEKINQLEQRVEVAEKKQIKYNIYTIIMWSSLGGVAMAIFLYVVDLIIKR